MATEVLITTTPTIQAIQGLKSFPSSTGLVQDPGRFKLALNSPWITEVVLCVLGPEGTNIEQAASLWARSMGIVIPADKTRKVLCETPEASLEEARRVGGEGILALYWTCAVYAYEAQLFFRNPEDLPFYTQYTMPLDEMQLACLPELVSMVNGRIPDDWSIASHPSPQYLVEEAGGSVKIVNSNAAAARACANGETQACITTEKARLLHGLANLHSFGSPPMVFFGGITAAGAEFLHWVYQQLNERGQWYAPPEQSGIVL